ncbi:MFS transporter [Pediococcus claussenii]|uniref:H+ antiporter-2 family protein n=1 Tax=Pediococcus claussenii (strain ATCC BAA-344 / DSM 14800 / JCM 18046 / KCTC 3811 / LMG 21948 / P06) TaxID=701521 RepID=G8PA67_PEDCP|nr:MFS transporter [Pediococcus claussenii]AEV94506.1 H+ antiporter-2 family protein [Pediococcus claussenii ATCC BAA-344]ANZ69723.1 MFS transporter [Pediococcus claussenii]ANZ71540.1 MFS transporter [Pediococcus claussenii]KRN19787.1 hypothetical protein IV79_GL001075 [Pediococcus claussenii]
MNTKAKLTIAAMAISIFLCMLDTTVMNIALPAIQSGLNISLENLSWAINVYTIVFAVFTIPLGRIADIFGRNKVYVLGLVLFGLGSLFSGFSNSAELLVAGRGIQSLGAAVIFPTSMTIGISMTNMANRRNVIAALGITQGLSSALGPTIGGIVTQYMGWRWIFFVNVPLILIDLVLCLALLQFKNENRSNSKIDWLGMLLSMGALLSITLALVKGNDWGWTSSSTIGLIIAFVFFFVLFILAERKVKDPMVRLDLFKNRQFDGAALGIVMTGVLLVAIMVIMPSFFTKVLDKSELMAALMITPTSVMIFIWAPIAGSVLEKIGPRLLIFIGMLLMACGYSSFLWIDPTQYMQILIALLFVGAGFGMIAGPVMILGAADFTGEMLTASQSVMGVLRQIGTVLAVAIFVSALSANISSAKSTALNDADYYIQKMDVSQQVKDSMRKKTHEQFKNSGDADSVQTKQSSSFVSKKQRQQIIEETYQKVMSKEPKNLPIQVKQVIYTRVTVQVDKKIKDTNSKVTNVVSKIKSNTKNLIVEAFIRPYKITFPFTVLAMLIALLFEEKRSYLKVKQQQLKQDIK